MEEIYEKISHYDGRSMAPNVLVRNLIIALNHECAISRAGDIYTRMDAVYSSKIKPKCSGVVEIEFGRDTLEACNNCVFHYRYNIFCGYHSSPFLLFNNINLISFTPLRCDFFIYFITILVPMFLLCCMQNLLLKLMVCKNMLML